MIADSAIIGFHTPQVIFDTTYMYVSSVRSKLSTWNKVKRVAIRLVDTTYPGINEKVPARCSIMSYLRTSVLCIDLPGTLHA